MWCDAMQCNVMWRNEMQCDVMQCNVQNIHMEWYKWHRPAIREPRSVLARARVHQCVAGDLCAVNLWHRPSTIISNPLAKHRKTDQWIRNYSSKLVRPMVTFPRFHFFLPMQKLCPWASAHVNDLRVSAMSIQHSGSGSLRTSSLG